MSASAPVPQRLVVISASTAEFDSRAERYARSVAARGHAVTIVARTRADLPREVFDPSGFKTIRVDVHAIDGLPLGRALRRRVPMVSRIGRPAATLGSHASDPALDSARPTTAIEPGASSPVSVGRRVRPLDWVVARLRLPLTIRAQTTAALAVAPPADVYLARGLWAIPTAIALGRRYGARVVYDIGDVYLEARSLARLHGPVRSYLQRAERGWARDADALITVNESLAELLTERLGAGRPTVILNTPPRYLPPPEPPQRFRGLPGVATGLPIVLYHGGLFAERGIEQLIDAVSELQHVVLVLMGYGALVPAIARRIREAGPAGRVVLLPAVPPTELLDWVASADVVAIPIQPTTLNHRYATPNKLWEAIAVGVPILASDLPGMAPVVHDLDAGVLVDPTDPADIARGLTEVLAYSVTSRAALRERLLTAARTRYSWEIQAETYLGLLGRLTGKPW